MNRFILRSMLRSTVRAVSMLALLFALALPMAGSSFAADPGAHDQAAAAAAQPSVPEQAAVWTCPMHPEVRSDGPGRCPDCGMYLEPAIPEPAPVAPTNVAPDVAPAAPEIAPVAPAAAPPGAGSATQLWTCGMHPQVIQDHPGDCPICHMKLTPLTLDPASREEGDAAGGATVVIDPAVVQNMGVRLEPVVVAPLRRRLRAAGFVEEAQPNIHDIVLRVSGWIERLHAHTEGLHVEVGDPLFELYSPDLQVGIEELIALRKRAAAFPTDASLDDLRRSAARKLELLGLDVGEVARLARLDRAPKTVTMRSPVAGHVTEKPVVNGSAVAAGEKVLRIVDHTTLWIDARVHEQDFTLVSIGLPVEARVAAQPGVTHPGEVVFIHPHLDETTRTARVRMAVPNPDLVLRPGMFASVSLEVELECHAVLVPREAVIDTGERQVVFVAEERAGRFEPRLVRSGRADGDGRVEILEGLSEGEQVVVSGQFLLDAESRMQEALRKFLDARGTQADGTAGAKAAPAAKVQPGDVNAAPAHNH